MKTVNIIIDNKPFKALEGDTILQVAKNNSIEIPTLCHDDRLDPFSSCFVCVVEIEGNKNLQPSCSTKVQEGMVIHSKNNKVKAARKTALELMLSNHYADCAAPCKQTCPAGVDVQGYISLIEKKQYSKAIKLIKEVNPLPAICGRVCVRPCEVACRRNLLNEGAPVGIDYLKRFAADKDLESEQRYVGKTAQSTGKKVAIIGAGPGGLSAAWFLQQKGHQCHIFEAAPKSGGWLRYGIPEYRLPNDILDKEVEAITELGTEITYNKKLGENLSYAELNANFDATVLTIGSQKGTLIGCPGDDAQNVFSGIDFLRNMEITGQKLDFKGKKVAVVGGGNTAMDCCRTSMRCGAEKVYVIYRRTEKEMPANPIEIHESKLEGIEYLFLTNPTQVNKDKDGKLKSLTLLKMELGEPDASGRRRPVPIEGSDFELDLDYVLAAIGQKTVVDFIDDINENTQKGSLHVNRWGDIDANKHTLQTGVENIFAAGDGVSGPATIIEAIAQAKTAAHSCNQFLNGEEIKPELPEFLSKKENFKEQISEDYQNSFISYKREEMPVLDANLRLNFDEVELGYSHKDIAEKETGRCLECGCGAYHTCDLKKHATEYQADQNRYQGDFAEHRIDFSHPYIEIDNNKCILCARCVRICNEQVGAKALGLVERGFETFVAPSMGQSLKNTSCENCGLCISTCPTGAISENKSFKPGPVKLKSDKTICNYCSLGCSINIESKGEFVWNVSGNKGLINPDGNLCKYPKFGYNYMNKPERLKTPLIKKGDGFEPISFDEAYALMAEKISEGIANNSNAFFGGARLSNEELYMIQRLARLGANTNQVGSFHYLAQGNSQQNNAIKNTELKQLNHAEKIYVVDTNLSEEHPVLAYKINSIIHSKGTWVEQITQTGNLNGNLKTEHSTNIKSTYYFIKALNYYLLKGNKQNSLFIKDNCSDFERYAEALLAEDFSNIVSKSGLDEKQIAEIADDYNKTQHAVIIFSEKNTDPATAAEFKNLALITGKLGKSSSGLIALKDKNNSQGLFDMAIDPGLGIGGVENSSSEYKTKQKEYWSLQADLANGIEMKTMLDDAQAKNMFIFGEDPVACASDKAKVENWLKSIDFMVVQDYTLTPTAKKAHLILPASAPAETGGSFTNYGKIIQQFEAIIPEKVEHSNLQQINSISTKLGTPTLNSIDEVRMDMFGLLPHVENNKHNFVHTTEPKAETLFKHGCDSIERLISEEFNAQLNN